ncbi:MAG: SMODS domain-containing nucleotidyltransferase, partial [Fimbriiglobus sp.]
MDLPTYFSDFLNSVRLTPDQVKDCRRGHRTLRDRLTADETLSKVIVSTFLQGSYRRSTAVRPKNDQRADVDVIVVTKLDRAEYSAEAAIDLFIPFCETHYKGKYRIQGRSIGIELTYVDLDIVPTAAPSESERGVLAKGSVTTEDTAEEAPDWRLVNSWVPLSERGFASAGRLLEAAKVETEWKLSPLYIPDREAKVWVPAHPLEQIKWT